MENLTEKHRQTVSENKKKQWVSRSGWLGWDFKCSVQPQTSSFHHVCLRFISRRASQFVAQVNLGHKSVWTLHFMIILAPLYILISSIITLFSVFSVTSVNQRRYIGVAGIRPTAAKTVSRLTGPGNTRDNARGQWGKMIETRDVTSSHFTRSEQEILSFILCFTCLCLCWTNPCIWNELEQYQRQRTVLINSFLLLHSYLSQNSIHWKDGIKRFLFPLLHLHFYQN